MSENPYEQRREEFDESAVFVAPPDEGWEEPPEPPEWPKWVGGVGLAVGALSGCCSLMGAASTALTPQLMQMAGAGQMDLPPVMTSPPLAAQIAPVAQVGAALLLIVAAAMCLAHKPASRVLHLVWALVAIALFIWAASVTLQMQAQIDQWIRDNPDSDFAQFVGQGPGMQGGMRTIIGLGIDAVLSLAWPVFCLIWFGLIKSRAEDFEPPPAS